MIRTIEIKDLDNFSYDQNINYEICTIPLYHGTRRYALECSQEEREKFYNACNLVMSFSKYLIDSGKINDD